MKENPEMIPLSTYQQYSTEEMLTRSAEFADFLNRRRTVRHFSDRPVSRELIENCIRAAGTAPSGANMQPWRFVIISNPEVKHTIRLAAEEEERDFYTHRAPKEWLEALAPLGTDSEKPFLETAPYLIAIFAEKNGTLPDGRTVKHYYVSESVGIATGMLITALHHAGLVSLTHTPSPMNFLNEILSRPSNEKPFLLLVVGYPADDAVVPNIQRKTLEEIALFIE
ncbi:MAG: nitroreductase family protein [Candidatus Kapabacteria bacterium]|nr:nitroreductase family protein [Candidatus Kapabacteria bacterium]